MAHHFVGQNTRSIRGLDHVFRMVPYVSESCCRFLKDGSHLELDFDSAAPQI
jgi:hypothetical protein